jgi:hypothetical protein
LRSAPTRCRTIAAQASAARLIDRLLPAEHHAHRRVLHTCSLRTKRPQIHQYAPATLRHPWANGTVELRVRTGHPWSGEVASRSRIPDKEWTLALRVRSGAKIDRDRCRPGTGRSRLRPPPDATMAVRRRGPARPADIAAARRGGPHVDAVRGCGRRAWPLVYCVERVDQPAGLLVG